MGRNRGFSLIEILVVLGIIGILSSFITPKVMSYTAKAKDVKAVSVLESLRTAAEIRYLEEGKTFSVSEEQLTNENIKDLGDYLSDNIYSLIEKNDSSAGDDSAFFIEIGGSRASQDGEKVYGGKIGFTAKAPDGKKSDGINIWFVPEKDKEYNLSGEKWIDL